MKIKKYYGVFFWIIVISIELLNCLTFNSIFAASINQIEETKISTIKVFSFKDNELMGVKLGMVVDDAIKILGKPKKIESSFEEVFGANIYVYYYDSGRIRLEPNGRDKYCISLIYTENPYSKGPRNIKVGDHTKVVLSKFPYEKGAAVEKEGNIQVKYIYGRLYNNEYKIDGINGYIEFSKNGEITAIAYKYDSLSLFLTVRNDIIRSIALTVHNN